MGAAVTCARCGATVATDARFCASCGAPVGDLPREERRIVTVMFADLSGFTEFGERSDAEVIKAVIDRTFEACADIITRYGGRVDKIIGDEIMAVFGAPQAHEDDAERTVRAALAIQRHLAGTAAGPLPVQMHIGINTGEVVAGAIGGSDAYTVLGDAVNTARRIGDAAEPGQILVGQATVDASTGAISYRRAGQVTAKGKRLPVTVWEAVAEQGLPGERALPGAPLIGREEELSVLESLARIVRRDRRAHAATLIGEAGMGKTRLAREFARRASAFGVRVLDGRALPYGTTSPAFALEQIVRGALLLSPDDGPDDLRERLEGLGLAGHTEQLLAFLGMREGSPAQPAGPAATQPGYSNPLLESALAVLVRTAEREGMIVCAFHELHWAEDEVLDAVVRLAAARAPVLVLALARPTLLERRPDWGAAIGTTVLPLERLPRARAAEILDALAPDIPPGVREHVLDRAGGNPFYLEELARLFIERGADETVAIPGTVQALVTARIDALRPREKRVLQDAAVVGERFWGEALERLDGPGYDDELAALVTHGFIEPADGHPLPGDAGYRFSQSLVRDVAYGSVPKHTRAQQHRIVGAWLEERGDDRRDVVDLIAYHYERAAVLAREIGDAIPDAEAKAREYLTRAGEHSISMDSAAAAAGFFRRALPFATSELDQLTLKLRLGEALVGIWQHEEGRAELTDALALARKLADRAAEGRALRLIADSDRMTGAHAAARDTLARALRITKDIGDTREEAEGLRSHGLLDLQQGRWSSAILTFRQALNRYRDAGDRRGEAWSLQNIGWASMLLGRLDEALDTLQEAQTIFGELGDDEGAGWCVGMRGWVLLLRGDVLDAGRIADELEHVIRVEHPEYAAHVGFALELQRILRAFVEVLRGHLGAAETSARAAIDTGAWQGAGWVQALAHYPLFMSAIMRRQLPEARTHLDAGAAAAASFGDPFYELMFVFARALMALEEGALGDAERELIGLRVHSELGERWATNAASQWLAARIALAKGEPDRARAALAGKIGRGNIALVSPARTRALRAEIATETGDVQAALDDARTAIEEAGEELVGRVAGLLALTRAALAADDAATAVESAEEALALLADGDWELERIRTLALLSRAYDSQRRHDEAAEAFDRARAAMRALPEGTDTAPLQALLHA